MSKRAREGAVRWGPTSELWEIVRHEQSVQSVLPLALEDEIVPLGDNVSDRASRVRLTERNTTVHATGRLGLALVLVEARREFLEILNTLARVAVRFGQTLVPKVPCHWSAADLAEKKRTLRLTS